MRALGSLRTLPLRAAGLAWRRSVRPFLPARRPALYAGVASSIDWKWFDDLLPRNFRPDEVDDIPGYEEMLVVALKRHVTAGDRVVVVGGGGGITAILAARLSGTGRVICFEAAQEQLPIINEALQRNTMSDRVEVRYGAVGQAIGVYGKHADAAPVISPEAIPDCDVLELDCEGAESIILDRMLVRPRVIIVETHGMYDAPTAATRERLGRLGYEVSNLGVAEPRVEWWCVRQDIRVLVAVRK